MKPYVAVTSLLFALLTLIHAWRVIVEPGARDPWFLMITVIAAALTAWGVRVWVGLGRRT
jgi:hypothetical protein